ncbi:hypothetical protein [uncultured Salinicola sp.]|uniref:hypothetical protein n=1 Tax=uncultured Salinicola sp. TaxID=1193542 RepID=UPI00262477EB|nr:hypothetical protein [uncultured Salinicola sp.]|tara:strand:- start:3926 stop:4297 length:372 start_codon:yes stop_codon:yes gene_type:complete
MRQGTTWKEESLITALRPFAIIAAHMPAEALEKDDFFAVDDEHPDIVLRTRDFRRAYEVVTRIDPAFRRDLIGKETLLDKTFGSPRWGWLAYTLLGLTGGIVSAHAHGWAEMTSRALQNLLAS